MQVCKICEKRLPAIFIKKLEGVKEVDTIALCLKCAHAMKMPIIEKNISGMELTEEDIERMSPEVNPDADLNNKISE